MAFIESPRFPIDIAPGAMVGPMYSTELVELASGHEQRNSLWSAPRRRYSVTLRNKTQAQIDDVLAFYSIAEGRFNGFRARDASDYQATTSNGRLGTGAVGTGTASYQLYKRRTSGANTVDLAIVKPVSGGVTVYRAASPVTIGAGAGQIAIDYTTGIVTFVADDSDSVSAVAVGATTDVTLGSALTGLAIGEKLWLEGLTGTVSTVLNDLAHPISNIVGAVYTISTSTSGLAYTAGGTGRAFPQAGEALTWAGTFDIPVRFDMDQMRAEVNRTSLGGSYTWDSIELVELRL